MGQSTERQEIKESSIRSISFIRRVYLLNMAPRKRQHKQYYINIYRLPNRVIQSSSDDSQQQLQENQPRVKKGSRHKKEVTLLSPVILGTDVPQGEFHKYRITYKIGDHLHEFPQNDNAQLNNLGTLIDMPLIAISDHINELIDLTTLEPDSELTLFLETVMQ